MKEQKNMGLYDDNKKQYNENYFRHGAKNVPIELRCGRMPIRMPEIGADEVIIADFAKEYKYSPESLRALVRKNNIKPVRSLTVYKVYRRKDLELIIPPWRKKNKIKILEI